MASPTTSSLPFPASPSEPWLPRRPSLQPEREILATRGQHLPELLRRYTLSTPSRRVTPLHEVENESGGTFDGETTMTLPKRGMKLIGDSKPLYQWYVGTSATPDGGGGLEIMRRRDFCNPAIINYSDAFVCQFILTYIRQQCYKSLDQLRTMKRSMYARSPDC
jgi:hypothetical protein